MDTVGGAGWPNEPYPCGSERCSSCRGLRRCAHSPASSTRKDRRVVETFSRWPPCNPSTGFMTLPRRPNEPDWAGGHQAMFTNQSLNPGNAAAAAADPSQPAAKLTPEVVV